MISKADLKKMEYILAGEYLAVSTLKERLRTYSFKSGKKEWYWFSKIDAEQVLNYNFKVVKKGIFSYDFEH